MDQIPFDLARLIAGYVQGTLSDADKARLDIWATQDPAVRELIAAYDDDQTVADGLAGLAQIPKAADWERTLQKYRGKRSKRLWLNGVGLAAAVLIVALVGWWAIRPGGDRGLIKDNVYGHHNDVLPGTNKAILKLGDGQQLVLEGGQREQFADGSAVMEIKDGMLAYQHERATDDRTANRHQLIVPKGGTYTLVLADGTKV